MAVRNDWGLKNLPTIVTLGMLYGSSLNRFNYSTLLTRLVNHDANPLFDGYANATHCVGTLLSEMASMIYSIFSEIVNIPLNP